MKSFDTDIKKYTEKTRLKASERRELRERVFAYMEYHPLPKQSVDVRAITEGIPSESFLTFHFSHLYMRVAGGVFALVLIIAPFFAEQSTPGDVLYFIKTGVNETIQGQLANSPYEKIEFETKLMERRITEARVLASEGKLTDEVKQQITDTVKEHTTAVQAGLAELRTQDAEGAAIAEISFNASLEVQSAMLGSDTAIEDESLVDSIMVVMNDAREEVVQSQVENTASYDSLIAQVERETTRAYELFVTIKESATEEEISDIDRRLSDINRLTEEAKQAHEVHPEAATGDLAATLGLIQKLVAFMSDIDVRETVALADLVPVMLSDAERSSTVQSEIEVLNGLKIEITERLTTLDEPGVEEKVSEALVHIDTLILQAGVALDTNEIVHAETSIAEARALMTDIDILTQQEQTETLPPTEVVPTEEEQIEEEETSTTTETVSEEVVE
jgi:DNA-binding protein YbaB